MPHPRANAAPVSTRKGNGGFVRISEFADLFDDGPFLAAKRRGAWRLHAPLGHRFPTGSDKRSD